MDYLPSTLNLMLLLDSVLGFLPVPVNVSVNSVNFHHVLRWDPGRGTPSGTQYMIFRRAPGKKQKRPLYTKKTSFKLKLNSYVNYHLSVQASYNHTLSSESDRYTFIPYQDTIIGPPKVSLAGYANCIQINISLPDADTGSGIDDIQTFYDAQFKVLLKRGKKEEESYKTRKRSFTLNNLNSGTQYCVQVHTEISLNKNTEPSEWNCTFTSILALRRDPVVLGAVAALLILFMSVLMTTLYCLYYTGFLGKLKATLPRVLNTALSQGHTLEPGVMIPDPVSICSEMEKQRKKNSPTMPHPATGNEDEDEDEEEGINIYVDRNRQLSSHESLCWGSCNVLKNSEPAVTRDYGRRAESTEVEMPDAAFYGGVTYGGLDENEAKAEGIKISFIPEESQIGIQGPAQGEVVEEKMKERRQEFDNPDNVNLFSVTLAVLGIGEEEEDEQKKRYHLTDFWGLSDLDPLLPTVLKQTIRNRNSQTNSHDQTAVELMQTTHGNFTETGYEGRQADTSGYFKACDGKTQHERVEEEEENDKFYTYMSHT